MICTANCLVAFCPQGLGGSSPAAVRAVLLGHTDHVCQFGFLPSCFTVWQWLALVDDRQMALGAGHCIHALFLDVSKAFDHVDQAIRLVYCKRIGYFPLVVGLEFLLFAQSLYCHHG